MNREMIAEKLLDIADRLVAEDVSAKAKGKVPEAFKKKWKDKDGDNDGKTNEDKPDFLKKAATSFSRGDLVKFKGRRKVYKILREQPYVDDRYDLSLPNGRPGPSGVEALDLMMADAEPEELLDRKGRNAAEAAAETFRSGKVVIDMFRLIREQYGEIVLVTPKGQIVVQTYHGGEYDGMESYKPSKGTKGDKMRFTPRLSRGEWGWSGGRSYHIKRPYKGEMLTSLLD